MPKSLVEFYQTASLASILVWKTRALTTKMQTVIVLRLFIIEHTFLFRVWFLFFLFLPRHPCVNSMLSRSCPQEIEVCIVIITKAPALFFEDRYSGKIVGGLEAHAAKAFLDESDLAAQTLTSEEPKNRCTSQKLSP